MFGANRRTIVLEGTITKTIPTYIDSDLTPVISNLLKNLMIIVHTRYTRRTLKIRYRGKEMMRQPFQHLAANMLTLSTEYSLEQWPRQCSLWKYLLRMGMPNAADLSADYAMKKRRQPTTSFLNVRTNWSTKRTTAKKFTT